MRLFAPIIAGFFLVGAQPPVVAESNTVDLNRAAVIYNERCALCHGPKGMGDGLLPIRIGDYPNTNLLQRHHAKQPAEIRRAIRWGSYDDSPQSRFSPPWVHELPDDEVEALARLVSFLRSDTTSAVVVLERYSSAARADGEALFRGRCVICHGPAGQGDGRLSDVISSPPPANLVASRLSRSELRRIVAGGGESVGRSDKMPPWGAELGDIYIERIVDFLLDLRTVDHEPD